MATNGHGATSGDRAIWQFTVSLRARSDVVDADVTKVRGLAERSRDIDVTVTGVRQVNATTGIAIVSASGPSSVLSGDKKEAETAVSACVGKLIKSRCGEFSIFTVARGSRVATPEPSRYSRAALHRHRTAAGDPNPDRSGPF